jgi:hypothetical protein
MRTRITLLLPDLFLAPATLWARAETGLTIGHVVDGQGAPLSSATVTATNTDARVSRTATPDAAEASVIPNLAQVNQQQATQMPWLSRALPRAFRGRPSACLERT